MLKELSIIIAGVDRDVKHVLDQVKKAKTAPLHVECVSFPDLQDAVGRLRPNLVIYSINGNVEEVEKTALAAAQKFSDLSWVIVSERGDPDLILQFFRMGAADFLRTPIQSHDIHRVIQKVIDIEERRNAGANQDVHRLIGVFSSKGGVGITAIASNLAVEMTRQKAGKTLLMDLVLQHGNVGDFLDFTSQHNLLDVLENFERLDSTLLENSLAKHASGCYVLPGPKRPEDEEFAGSNQMTEIFQFLKGIFHYVVADLGHEFTKAAVAFMDLADTILLVTTPDVPSLCNARDTLAVFRKLGYSQEKVKVILNRWKMKGEIEVATIKKNLSLDLMAQLPDDSANCLAAVNQGKPLYEIDRHGEFLKAIQRLASEVVEITKKGA